MSVPEIIWRTTASLRRLGTQSKASVTSTAVPTPGKPRHAVVAIPPPPSVAPDLGHAIAASETFLADRLTLLGRAVPTAGGIPDWNTDPATGRRAVLTFGPTLDYRNANLVGDIKYLWEVNRHLHLVAYAQAWAETGNERYRSVLERSIESWLHQCPFPLGPNWSSGLELAIRLINWSLVWRIAAFREEALLPPPLRQQFLESIYRQTHFIKEHYSRFSSANNHRIGEAAGVFVAAATWPYWDEMHTWQQEALEILSEEVRLQTTKEGMNRELSVGYHVFVLEFLVIVQLTAKAANVELPTSITETVARMRDVLSVLIDAAGHIPMFGDSDDGHVFRLAWQNDFDPIGAVLNTASVLTGTAPLSMDPQSLWLLGGSSAHAAKTEPPREVAWPDAGYYLVGRDLGTNHETRLWFDAGPLGYLKIAAHGHADALAFSLTARGEELLVDPGTYAYHTEELWRNYFRGTSAHNTARVDGEDQSVSGGNFMWLRHATTTLESADFRTDASQIIASHDGYTRLRDPVVHRRKLIYDKIDGKILVSDEFKCTGKHHIEIFWHFSEHVALELSTTPPSLVARGARTMLLFTFRGKNLQVEHFRGDTTRPAGWISRRFGEKQATSTICVSATITGSTELGTDIALLPNDARRLQEPNRL